jgi:hypothetical protein
MHRRGCIQLEWAELRDKKFRLIYIKSLPGWLVVEQREQVQSVTKLMDSLKYGEYSFSTCQKYQKDLFDNRNKMSAKGSNYYISGENSYCTETYV